VAVRKVAKRSTTSKTKSQRPASRKVWRVEVATRTDLPDPVGATVLSDIAELGIPGVKDVRFVRVFFIEMTDDTQRIRRVASELLSDAIVDVWKVDAHVLSAGRGKSVIEVARKPGVMDPTEASTLAGIRDMGLSARSVHTARRYILTGSLKRKPLELIAQKILANASIEEYFLNASAPSERPAAKPYRFRLRTVDLLSAEDDELMNINRRMSLYLDLNEMREIQKHFAGLKRNPTDVELEALAQTWSEHCVHKTFRSTVRMDGEVIQNLLRSTVMRVTRELDKPWCVSVFVDNAGVMTFDENHHVCFKVETHNHPSAIEPYGGSATGIGGVIRDPMGTGLGAKPIANTDIFCFAPPDMPYEDVPAGALHPKRVMRGVVAGVRDYGNRMGIPTVNGAVYFDERFVGNPLVYCGNVGLLPVGKVEKKAKKGDLVVVVGGRTGRDGIHGATFSSAELTEESETVSSGAVQIGNPIEEKRMLDVLMKARDLGLYTAVHDCGAGGLSGAVGELGEELGVEVHLDRVPLKYQGLAYWEIWVSEAQERMVISVPRKHEKKILDLFASEDVEATVIGSLTGRKRLELFYQGNPVADLSMDFLHHGVPLPEREATWTRPVHPEPKLPKKPDLGKALKTILSDYNVASKEWIIRQYDHEVQGASCIKSLVGVANDGPGDAAVLCPIPGSHRGIILSVGLNPRYADIDPYWMVASAIDEALRNLVAVGGDLEQVAILDNTCWGNTDKPEILGGLVRAAKACYDVAKVYGTPFISGKDSLNNEYATASGTISIPGCLLISAIGVMPDVTRAVTMDFKHTDNLIYLVGLTHNELGGSQYFAHLPDGKWVGNDVPQLDPEAGRDILRKVAKLTAAGLVRAAHDLSEGGLAVALAEMAFAGGLGCRVDLRMVPKRGLIEDDSVLLFSESNSRLLLEVLPENAERVEKMLAGVPHAQIGHVTLTGRVQAIGHSGRSVIDEDIAELKEAWQKPLRW